MRTQTVEQVDNDQYRIELTQGKYALVDAQGLEIVGNRLWQYHNGYAKRKQSIGKAKVHLFMHREILQPPEGMFVDHINHDKLDNRLSNLRVVTCSQNLRNARKTRSSRTSQYKGVSLYKAYGKWNARIYVPINGTTKKNIHLGYFDTEIEAALAYDKAATEYFGEYANLNFN